MATRRRLVLAGIGVLLPMLLAALLLAAPARTPGQDDFAARLAQADALRSADPERSAALLAGLEAEAAAATPLQRQQIEYLRAYRLAVFGNRPEEAAERAMALFDRADDVDLKFRAGALAASSLAIVRDFDESLRILNRVLSIRHAVRDRTVRHTGLYTAALLYHEMGQYRLSLRYADEILADDPEPHTRCAASLPQLDARQRLDLLPVDGGPLGASIDHCLAVGEGMIANFLRLVLARNLASDGRADDALELLRLHMPEIDGIGYQRLTVDAHALAAELMLDRADLDGASAHAAVAIAQARSFSGGPALVSAHRVRYEIARRRGDAVAALAHYRDYVDAGNAQVGDAEAREQAYAIVHDETTAQSRRIEMLVQQNQILALQQEISLQSRRKAWIVVAMLLASIVLVGAWTWRVVNRRGTPD